MPATTKKAAPKKAQAKKAQPAKKAAAKKQAPAKKAAAPKKAAVVKTKKAAPKKAQQNKKKAAPKKAITKKGAPKQNAKDKALKAQKAIQKGVHAKGASRIRTSVHFRRPKTLILPRKPRYSRKSAPKQNKLDDFCVVKHPLTTESAMKKIEEHNTLVFIVDIRANKHQIGAAIRRLYNVKPIKVNTLIRPDGQKKAFIRFPKDVDGLDIANKIGII